MTTEYFWDSDTMDEFKVVCKGNEGKLEDVGARPANNWGLFDVNGNVFEWGLDSSWGSSDLSSIQSFRNLTNIFVPKCDGTATRAWLGGGAYNSASTLNWFKLRYASSGEANPGSDRGFRVSVIMD
jgi:formylglycine-generating enzyme required for sulfatase activity